VEWRPRPSAAALFVSEITSLFLRLLRNDELVNLRGPILVVSPMTQNRGEAFLDELFGDIAAVSRALRVDPLVIAIGDGDTFALFVFPIFRLHIVDADVHRLSDEAFSQEPAVSRASRFTCSFASLAQ
jgi:hypothetical protein